MAQTIKLKRSATQGAVPSTSALALGEIAINTYDGNLFIKKNDGSESIVTIGGLADNAVTSAKIAANAVEASEIATNAVGISELNVSDGTSGQVLTTDGAGSLSFSSKVSTAQSFYLNSATGDGSTTDFSLSTTPAAESNIIAFIDGVFQTQDSYTFSGTTLSFSSAPPNGTEVTVYVVGAIFNGNSVVLDTFSGDGSTTQFTLSENPENENNTQVYIDGVYQQKSEYSVSSQTLTFSSAPPTGTNNIEVVAFSVTNLTVLNANSVSSASIAANAVTSTHIAANQVGISELNLSDGTSGQAIVTDGAGTLSFSTISSYTDSDVESYLDGGTSTPTFSTATVTGNLNYGTLNDGTTTLTSTVAELNYLDGVTGITLDSANELLVVGGDGSSIVSDSTLAVDTSNNRLGINQSSPEVTLHMTGEGAQTAQIRMEQYNDSADAPDLRTRRYRGTIASPSAISSGDYLYRSNHEYWNGSALIVGGTFAFDNTNNANRTQFAVSVTTDGTSADANTPSKVQFKIDGNDSGAITFNNAYKFPTSDGSSGQVLTTNGSGTLSFTSKYTDSDVETYLDGGTSTPTFATATVSGTANFGSLSDGTITITAFADEDNMVSNSATLIPTQQSVKAYVDAEVAGIVDSAPGTLDTLNELAAALGDDANFSTTVTNSIALKAPLASPDFTGDATFDTSTLVIDSTNNRVGIGTTSVESLLTLDKDVSTAYDPTDDSAQRSSTNTLLLKNEDGTTNSFAQIAFDLAGTGQSIARIVGINSGASTSDLAFVTEHSNTKSEKMRITSEGYVGIGTDSPIGLLHLKGDTNSNGSEIYLQVNNNNTTDNLGVIHFGNNIDSTLSKIVSGTSGANNSSYLTFSTSSTGTQSEAMRIDASGNLLVGTTSSSSSTAGIKLTAAGTATFVRDGVQPVYVNRLTSDGDLAVFAKDGTTVGVIQAYFGDLKIGTGDTAIIFGDGQDAIYPGNTSGGSRDAAIDLGLSSSRFKDLHLSGTVNAATLNVDGGTIKLDGNYPVGTSNVALGDGALSGGSLSGANNTAIGTNAGASLTTGNANVAIGAGAMDAATSDDRAIAIGINALGSMNNTIIEDNYNIGIGYGTGASLTTGFYNTLIGGLAGDSITTASYNTAIGTSALSANTTGIDNVAVGYAALDANTTGDNNTAVGKNALGSNSTGLANTAIGEAALGLNTTANFNTSLGFQAAYGNTTGTENIGIGHNALFASSTGNYNTAIGGFALDANTTASYNVAVGYDSLTSNTTGERNVAVGWNTLSSETTGSRSTALGHNALANQNFTGGEISYNTAVGHTALNANTTGNENTALGYSALTANTTGAGNTAIGPLALDANTTGDSSIGIGTSALSSNTTGIQNYALGTSALFTNTTGNNNIAIGYTALYANTGTENTAIGLLSGRYQTGANYNTFLGSRAGYQVSGSNNVCIGAYGASNATSGSNSIYIGYNVQPSSATDSSIVIGASVSGKGNNTGYIYPPGGGNMYQASNLTTWSQVSDERIKKNIKDNNVGLNAINQIRVRNFEYRTEDEIIDFDNPSSAVVKKEGIQLGVIAQEIETIFPDVITEESTGVKTVNTDNFTWYLVNAVKELSTQVDELKQELLALRGE
jgi:hypothetical protein